MYSRFEITTTENYSRIGMIHTSHGDVATPFFMPDATRASVRGVLPSELDKAGICAGVVNTYHLMLRPGAEHVRLMGGVHEFMNWRVPLLSDSGGYQVYSLIHKNPELGKITEEGAVFRSVLDGSKYILTPERSIQIQFDLGVDMMVVLDDPRPNTAPTEEMIASVERTIRWAKRCRDEYDRQVVERGFTEENRPLLFGVVQGGLLVEERKRCAEELAKIGFDGYGFGGRHIDSKGIFLEEIIRETARAIPSDKLRFALGIGTPHDIVRCHTFGWDMFDCVIPTREGRHGRAFIRKHEKTLSVEGDFYSIENLTAERFRKDKNPIDEHCDCPACGGKFTRAYIRHLFASGDPLGARLLSLHNVRFYAHMMFELQK